VRQVHIGHSAASQLADNFILADFAAGRGDHGLASVGQVGRGTLWVRRVGNPPVAVCKWPGAGCQPARRIPSCPTTNAAALIAWPPPPAGPRVPPDGSAAPAHAPAPGR